MKVLLRASLMGRGVLSSAGQTRSSHRLLPRLPTSSATMTLPPYASRATDQVRVDGTRNLTTLRCGASRNGLVLAERPGRRAWGWTRHGGAPISEACWPS